MPCLAYLHWCTIPFVLRMNPTINKLKEAFHDLGIQGYLVGGYVRDTLLGLSGKDLDIVVPGDPYVLAHRLASILGGSFVPMGQAHQMGRVVLSSPFDKGNYVRFIDVSGIQGSIYNDLGQRDFTADAMAVPLDCMGINGWSQHILDPFDGRKDIQSRTLRVVRDSVFQDDPLRMLRAVRLSATRDLQIEPHTFNLIRAHSRHITMAAPERVRDEFLAVLSLKRAKERLRIMDSLGLLCCIMPELECTKGVDQPVEHHWDVFNHSIEAVGEVERVVPPSKEDTIVADVPWNEDIAEHFAEEVSDGQDRITILKLAALLHDIAKPKTKKVQEDGRTRFFGHHTEGASMVDGILQRLRVSRRGIDMVSTMVEYHLRPKQMSQGDQLPSAKAVYRYFRDLGDVAVDTIYLNLCDFLAARGPNLDVQDWANHINMERHVLSVGLEEQNIQRVPKLITGHHLMEALDLPSGPEIGDLLEAITEAQVTGLAKNRKEALALARKIQKKGSKVSLA